MFPKIFSGPTSESKNDESLLSPSSPSSDAQAAEPNLGDDIPAAVDTSDDPPTKMAQAIDIYRRMTRKKGATRKEIIEVFMLKVGLTKAGAATYYQMIKKSRRPD